MAAWQRHQSGWRIGLSCLSTLLCSPALGPPVHRSAPCSVCLYSAFSGWLSKLSSLRKHQPKPHSNSKGLLSTEVTLTLLDNQLEWCSVVYWWQWALLERDFCANYLGKNPQNSQKEFTHIKKNLSTKTWRQRRAKSHRKALFYITLLELVFLLCLQLEMKIKKRMFKGFMELGI